MASVPAIRDGLKTRLETISGLRAYDTVPGDVVVPAAVVAPAPGEFLQYDSTQCRGSDDFTFVVLLLVSLDSARGGQDALDAYLAGSGTSSVKTAIEGASLGGGAAFATVTAARNYGTSTFAGVQYYSVEFVVEVGS